MRSISRFARHFIAAIAVSAVLLLTSGCSSYNRQWQTAARQPLPSASFEGPWRGSWISEVNGHNGQLLCLVTKINDHEYRARYRATYQNVLHFNSTVILNVAPGDGLYRLNGRANLGWLAGGVYEYAGEATATNFYSTYKSKYDHGTYRLTRPTP